MLQLADYYIHEFWPKNSLAFSEWLEGANLLWTMDSYAKQWLGKESLIASAPQN